MSVSELKTRGKAAFKANYWRCVAAALLLVLLIGGTGASGARSAQDSLETADVEVTEAEQGFLDAFNQLTEEEQRIIAVALLTAVALITVVSILLKIFLFNPLKVGCYRFFRKNAEDSATRLGVIGEGFGAYGHTLATLFLTDLFTLLWTLLFLIPGVVKAYSYRLAPFILRDNPELSALEVITRSRQLMKGNKWRAFVLDLSFIGWFLLGAVTLGIVDLFWAVPYHQSAEAALYLDIKGAIAADAANKLEE